MSRRITVVGLGPGPLAWTTAAARDALRRVGARVFVRTALHPAVADLLAPGTFESFDALYEAAEDLAALHEAMAEHLAASAAEADTVLGLPGDGTLGEAVLGRLRSRGVQVDTVPGVPFAVAALGAAGLDAPEGVQSVDATALGGSGVRAGPEPDPRWVVVVTGIFSRAVAGDVKLALSRVYPAAHPAVVVRHAGLPDEQRREVPLVDLDRDRAAAFDHLTHVVLPPVPTEVPTGAPNGLRAVVARLRAPEIGCPWDLEQTHVSLIPYAIEEAYEVVDAIREGTSADLMEELGDLLLQVVLHAEIADQESDFDLNDVMRGLSQKLIRRHPHVFGETTVRGAADVVQNWDRLKAAEKGADAQPGSAMDGLLRSWPALKLAAESSRRAVKAGFEWQTRAGALAKVREELDELLAAETLAEREEELGDLLWMLAYLGRTDGIDAEEALRGASRKFEARFRELERRARAHGWESLKGRSPSELLALWQEAKQAVRELRSASASP